MDFPVGTVSGQGVGVYESVLFIDDIGVIGYRAPRPD